MLFHVEPQFYSGEIPIISDIIHVSGGDDEGDFENALAPATMPSVTVISKKLMHDQKLIHYQNGTI